ncbi:MAG: Asp-tRNA(Asn)/Glu-tRNA(Gln) amidotransferase subunit GatC [Gammaproteobacteria bacterium]
MSLGLAEVERIAHLARLAIRADDIPGYARDLNAILGLVAEMQAVDTHGVEPLAHPVGSAQRLRADAVTEPNRRDDYQTLAPQAEAGLYLVPQVIE